MIGGISFLVKLVTSPIQTCSTEGFRITSVARAALPITPPTPILISAFYIPLGESLLNACRKGNSREVAKLAANPFTPLDFIDKYGKSALALSCEQGDGESVVTLLKAAKQRGIQDLVMNQTDETGIPSLTIASIRILTVASELREKYQKIIERLLVEGADVDGGWSKSSPLVTPLMHACHFSFFELVRLFLAHGANVRAEDQKGRTPLYYACLGSRLFDGKEQLALNVQCIRLLLDKGSDANHVANMGSTPLSEVCQEPPTFPLVRLLLAKGADPCNGNSVFYDHRKIEFLDRLPPLHSACLANNIPLIDLFLKFGADVNASVNINGDIYTPFIAACSRAGNAATIYYLLANGASRRIISRTRNLYSIVAIRPKYQKYFTRFREKRVFATKKLAMMNSIANRRRAPIHYEGWFSPIFYSEIAKQIKKTNTLEKGVRKELLQAFSKAADPMDSFSTAIAIQRGHLTIIPAGWEEHAIALVFYRGYFAICNRGDGVTGHSTAKFFRIDISRIDENLIRKIFSMNFNSDTSGIFYFYNELPTQLAANQNALCLELDRTMYSSLQTVGNCSYASAAGALRAALGLLYTKGRYFLDVTTTSYVRETSKEILFTQRLGGMEEYLTLHPPSSSDWKLVHAVWKKMRQRLSHRPRSLGSFPEIQHRLMR